MLTTAFPPRPLCLNSCVVKPFALVERLRVAPIVYNILFYTKRALGKGSRTVVRI